jgi:hypothetical protein
VSGTKKPKILSDHKQIGKKFFPSAALLGLTEVHYIERILPEIAWMAYLIRRFGVEKGIHLAVSFIEVCYSLHKTEFSLFSKYRLLTSADWAQVRKALTMREVFLEYLDAFTPFVRCYPEDNAFVNLFDEAPTDIAPSSADIELARDVVRDLFDRRSERAATVQSIILWADLKLGKYHVPENYPLRDFNSIFGDGKSDARDEAASHARMHVNSTHAYYAEQIGESWAKYFWNRGKDLTPLRSKNETPEGPDEDKLHPIVKFGRDYDRYAWRVVDDIWSKLPVDIFESEVFEVIGALLARQCNLAVKLANNVDLWDYHAGPLFLRPMTDGCITIAWILKDRVDRARKFILYGLGQEKLEIERLRSVLGKQDAGERRSLEERIEIQEAWLESQHYSFLQHVDFGSWSGISTRKMAEEAERLNLYDFAYTGWSHAAHGTWNHIGKFDALPSPEPLHKHIWQPCNLEHGAQVDVVVQATKYFDEFCTAIVEEFELKMGLPPPNAWLNNRLKQLFAEMEVLHPPKG